MINNKNVITLSKDIKKLEIIGKSGKVNKLINISLNHLDILKNKIDTSTLRVVGYVIKGIFLLIKKYYDQIYKETQLFIEIHIDGKKRKEKEDQTKSKIKPDRLSTHFSAVSLNSEYSNLTQMIESKAKTKNRITWQKPDEEDKNFLNKVIEKSIKKEDNEKENIEDSRNNIINDHIKIEEDFQFNSKDLFSNFINFDLDPFSNEDKRSINHAGEGLFEQNDEIAEDNNQGEDLHTDIKPIRNDLEKLTETYDKILKSKQMTHHNKKLVYDYQTLIDYSNNEIKLDKRLPPYATRLLIADEIEKFKETISHSNNNILIDSLIDSEFIENIEEYRNENIDNQTQIEKFRDGPISTNRKSETKSKILSNISLSEVFDSTNKKLLNKNELFLNFDNTMILEEDSNFNLNTVSLLKTNLNLEFPEIYEENTGPGISIQSDIITTIRQNLRHDTKINLTAISDELHYTHNDYPKKEIFSYSFYNLLIIAQNEDISISQEEPFGDIFI